MILNATLAIHNVLGYLPQDFGKSSLLSSYCLSARSSSFFVLLAVGSTMYDVISPEYKQQIEVAIQQALLGAPATVQYKMKGRKGYVEVVTSAFSLPHSPVLAFTDVL